MKTYRYHNCTKNHRKHSTFVECAIKSRFGVQVLGEGPIASIAWCSGYRGRGLTYPVSVYLFEDESQLRSHELTGEYSCCGQCVGRHELVRIDLEGQQGK